VISVTPRPLFTPGKDAIPIVQEVGWALRPVLTGAENLAFTWIRSPDRPARSQMPGWVPETVWTDSENLAPTGIRSPDSPSRRQIRISTVALY